ncbi:MAG: hypothetical protein Kow006_33250 [Gammaproteobacteria bacterium]
MSENQFQPGDVLVFRGETYQVLENLGDGGRVIPFPSEETVGEVVAWHAEMRRIGHEPLPAPTPCSTGECPTQGNPLPVHFHKPPADR